MKDSTAAPLLAGCAKPGAGLRFVFGPVPSRRLGRSLGIDTVLSKTCNWNCAYCQLGRTHPLTNTRKSHVPPEAIVAEVATRLAELPPGSLDWITFVSSGEGTLYRDFGAVLAEVRRIASVPVAVITNGSLLSLPSLREELRVADAVLPTLDAGDEALFRKLNRPHRQLTFAQHVAGIEAFARLKRRGKLWIEVMLVAGLNDTDPALRKLAALFDRIRPDAIHLTLPSRCPVEPWVHAPDAAGLARALAILGEKASIAASPETAPSFASSEIPDIAAIARRHPLRSCDLARLLPDWTAERIESHVASLLAAGVLQRVERDGQRFLAVADLRYPSLSALPLSDASKHAAPVRIFASPEDGSSAPCPRCETSTRSCETPIKH